MDPATWTEDAAYSLSEHAYLLHTEGRYQESLTLFEGLLDIYPDDLYYRDAVSALHLALGQPEEAVRQASLVIDSEPTYANAFVRRCEGYLLLGMSREAERDLEQLRALRATGHVRRMEMRLMAVRRAQLAQASQRVDK
jgi:tetratricopeptide (TPR) repeat protein